MRERIAAGGLALGLGLRQARTVDIGRAMATAGVDWLFVDLEHSSMPLDVAVQISVAAADAGIAPIVRVPAGDFGLACRALDGGAHGIVMPHVDDPEQAAAFVRACRYPPAGVRGVTTALPHTAFAPLPLAEGLERSEADVLLIAMVETEEAAAHADAIASTPGLDGIMVGTQDLSVEVGRPGDITSEPVAAAVATTIEACNRHGKLVGLGGVGDPALLLRYHEQGVHFGLIGSDLSLLMAAVSARVAALRP